MKTVSRKVESEIIDTISVKKSYLKDNGCISFLTRTLSQISREDISEKEIINCLESVKEYENCSIITPHTTIDFLKKNNNIEITIYRTSYYYYIS